MRARRVMRNSRTSWRLSTPSRLGRVGVLGRAVRGALSVRPSTGTSSACGRRLDSCGGPLGPAGVCPREASRRSSRDAWSCHVRTRRRAGGGARGPEDHRADRRDHPPDGDVHLRQRPVALPRRRAGRPPGSWGTSTSASSRRSAPRCAPSRSATSSSGPSSPPTTRARSAGPATRPTACTPSSSTARIGTQAERARIPLRRRHARRHPRQPDADLIPSLLAASDVLGTGWFAAVAAEAGPGKTVAVVGDGAVGLMAILAAKQLGAERIIAMSAATPERQSSRASLRRHRHRRGARRGRASPRSRS